MSRAIVIATLAMLVSGCAGRPSKNVATRDEALHAMTDVWGEAALRQPGGPSYAFFENLLPPLRYVDASFRHYPIVLSAPRGTSKVRLLSNGSQINALARQPNWIGERGTPVTFRVGRDLHLFGSDLDQLQGPRFIGMLPIVSLTYRHGRGIFDQEIFASVDPELSKHGVALVRLGLSSGSVSREEKFEVMFESPAVLKAADGVLRTSDGKVLACFDPRRWEYIPSRCTLNAWLKPRERAELAIYTEPADAPIDGGMSAAFYDHERRRCADVWTDVVNRGTTISVPEGIVNQAWRAMLIGNFMLINGNLMRYSAGNQYAGLYIGEGGDATRTLALYNHADIAKDVMPPLLAHTRKGLEFHQAGFKLQMLAHVYFLTRDAQLVRSLRQTSADGRKPGWQTELDVLLDGREPSTGLFPAEKYAGDLEERIVSLNSNANGWRGLRDMALVLEEIGELELAAKVAASATEFRGKILAALDKSIRRDVDPPFVPLGLIGSEEPFTDVLEKRLSNYWNVMIKYALGSRVFPVDSEYADAIIDYMRRRRGLMMGLNRSRNPGRSFQVHEYGINELYGMRYTLALLERDEPDRALVSFYGKLAQGCTRDTFIGGEGASILPIDGPGRQLYLPPNSAANAHFLQALRYVLVQDYDLQGDDGQPDTLRLLFATPRAWLADGKRITVERAPTMFGEVSLRVVSQVKAGRLTGEIRLPDRAPGRTLLRLRLPVGYRMTAVRVNGRPAERVDPETIDLTGATGTVQFEARVSR